MDDDTLLTNYLLQSNDEDELWESDEEFGLENSDDELCDEDLPFEVVESDLYSEKEELAEFLQEKESPTRTEKDCNKRDSLQKELSPVISEECGVDFSDKVYDVDWPFEVLDSNSEKEELAEFVQEKVSPTRKEKDCNKRDHLQKETRPEISEECGVDFSDKVYDVDWPFEVVNSTSKKEELAEFVQEKVSPTHKEKDCNKMDHLQKELRPEISEENNPGIEKKPGKEGNKKGVKKSTVPAKKPVKEGKIQGISSKLVETSCDSSKKGEAPKEKITEKSLKAVKAKEQRERQKKHLQGLNETVEELKREKAGFQRVTAQLNSTINELKDEIGYLKGVIANQSELASILRSVANTPGIELSCAFLKDSGGSSGKELTNGKNKKRKHDSIKGSGRHGGKGGNPSNGKKKKVEEESGCVDAGVCVHVRSGKVSLEFCAECSKKANITTLCID